MDVAARSRGGLACCAVALLLAGGCVPPDRPGEADAGVVDGADAAVDATPDAGTKAERPLPFRGAGVFTSLTLRGLEPRSEP